VYVTDIIKIKNMFSFFHSTFLFSIFLSPFVVVSEHNWVSHTLFQYKNFVLIMKIFLLICV
jgi:hypothetical protein